MRRLGSLALTGCDVFGACLVAVVFEVSGVVESVARRARRLV